MLDIEKLLVEHEGETPCGENFEYDALLLEVREAIEGKPEQQIGEDNIIEGEEPDWKLVKKNCLELCGKTHNLEVIVSLTQSLLHIEGYSGLADGSALLAAVVDKFWGCIHPQLDPDDNDPIERLNMLAVFEDFNFLLTLQKIELLNSKGVGSVSLYDIRHSHSKKEGDKESNAIDSKLIDAIFKSSDTDAKEKVYESLSACIDNFKKISSLLIENEHVGAANAPNFKDLLKSLDESKKIVGSHLNRAADNADVLDGDETINSTSSTSVSSARSKGINSREDVILAIQEIEDFYYKNEPGSPIPILLQRAKGLVNKDFISLMEDLAPDSIGQVELVLGNASRD